MTTKRTRVRRSDYTADEWAAHERLKQEAFNAKRRQKILDETPEQREARLVKDQERRHASPETMERARQRASRYYEAHKSECHARAASYWQSHKEAAAVREKRWRAENPHKVRSYEFNRRDLEARQQMQTPMDPETMKRLRQERVCYFCGVGLTLEPKHVCTLTVDHLVPLVRGGSHSDDNLVAACLSCNSSKGKLLPEEFFAKMAADRAKPIKKFRKNRPRLQA